jgi:ABC-type Fe3+ transport system permease subunit
VFVGYIRTIPRQLDESARIDGASDLIIFGRIIYPLIGPATASVIIFISLWTWNDFVNPLLILGTSKFYTITIGVYRAVGQYTQRWEDVFAIVFMAIFPVIIFYLSIHAEALRLGAYRRRTQGVDEADAGEQRQCRCGPRSSRGVVRRARRGVVRGRRGRSGLSHRP